MNAQNMYLSEQADTSSIMGHQLLVSTSNPGHGINYEEVNALLEKNGFSRRVRKPDNNDAWRRATSKITCNVPVSAKENLTIKTIVVNNSSGEPLERLIQVTYVNQAGKEVSKGENIATITYNSDNNAFETKYHAFTFPGREDMDDYISNVVRGLINAAHYRFYNEEVNCVSIPTIGYTLRMILMDLGNTYKHFDAAWFIPIHNAVELENLKTLYEDLRQLATRVTGHSSCFNCVATPIYESVDQKKQIQNDFINHVSVILQSLEQNTVADTVDFDSNRGLGSANRKLNKFEDTLNSILDQAQKYKELLHDDLKQVDDAINAVRTRIYDSYKDTPLVKNNETKTRRLTVI